MINRRHIRVKVMQSAYTMLVADTDNLNTQDKYLFQSINRLHALYVLQFKLLLAIRDKADIYYKHAHKKFISNTSVWDSSDNFIANRILLKMLQSKPLSDYKFEKDMPIWQDHNEIIDQLWTIVKQDATIENYMTIESPSFQEDKEFIIHLFKTIIAPSEALHDFYESEIITWVDDIPFVNTWVLQQFYKLNKSAPFILDGLYKDEDDKEFAKKLLHKTILNYSKYEQEIIANTPNWDADRITRIDKLLMAMAIAEFLNFPSIPTKVTINEYIEIAKDYATHKSGYFINGVLDKLVDDFTKDNRIEKSGRGLL